MEGFKKVGASISTFKAGDFVEGFYLVSLCELKVTTTNSKYLNMFLEDSTGQINAKVWECYPEDAERFKQGEIVKIRGQVIEWQGNLQLKIEKIRLAEARDNVDPKDFVKVAPYPSSDMYDFLYDTANGFKDRSLRVITCTVLERNKKALFYYPAAKSNHHAIFGGLLYHTSTMLRAARALVPIYDFINEELLYAGVILHDMGKIEEMAANELGMVSEYTVEGNLLGHIIQGIVTIQKLGEELECDKNTVMLLSHMILSHHYYPEYGSPKFPMIPEAELLHYLDVMDARMYDMRKAYENIGEGEFSDRLWSLGNRQIFKP